MKIPTFTNLHQRTHTGIDNTENGANVSEYLQDWDVYVKIMSPPEK